MSNIKGKWHFETDTSGGVHTTHIIGAGDICPNARIAELNPYLKHKNEFAHLIASAPDLLEACKYFLALENDCHAYSLNSPCIEKMKQAIAKAEGREKYE